MRLRSSSLRPRPALIALALLSLPALTVGTAAGAPATRETSRILFIACDATTPAGARAAMELSTFESTIEVDVRLYAPGAGEDDPPVVSSDPDFSRGTVAWEGDVITGSVPVFNTASGALLGEATFAVTLAAAEPETIEGRMRNGNQIVRESVTFFPLTVTGTLTFPRGPSVAVSCAGVSGESFVFRNNPRAQISTTDVSQAFCDLEGADGRRLLVNVDASSFTLLEFAPHADPDVDPPLLFGGAEDALFTRSSLTATAPMFALSGDEPVFVGDATVSAQVDAGPPKTRFIRDHRSHVRILTWPLTFTGTITMPDGRAYDMAECTGHREAIQVLSVP